MGLELVHEAVDLLALDEEENSEPKVVEGAGDEAGDADLAEAESNSVLRDQQQVNPVHEGRSSVKPFVLVKVPRIPSPHHVLTVDHVHQPVHDENNISNNKCDFEVNIPKPRQVLEPSYDQAPNVYSAEYLEYIGQEPGHLPWIVGPEQAEHQ